MPSFRSYIDLLSVLGDVCVCQALFWVLGYSSVQIRQKFLSLWISFWWRSPKQRKMFIASPLGWPILFLAALPLCGIRTWSNPNPIASFSINLLLFSHLVMSDSFTTPWALAHQALPFMGFPRQLYWNGLPFPPPGHLPNPGTELTSPALQADSLLLSHQGSLLSID